MRKTAIILATAAIFDLGIVVVASHAQQAPDTRSCANGKHIPDAQLSACRDTAPFNPSGPSGPAGQARTVDMFLKIDRVNTVQACTARRGTVEVVEGQRQCRLSSDGASSLSGPAGSLPGGIPPRH